MASVGSGVDPGFLPGWLVPLRVGGGVLRAVLAGGTLPPEKFVVSGVGGSLVQKALCHRGGP